MRRERIAHLALTALFVGALFSLVLGAASHTPGSALILTPRAALVATSPPGTPSPPTPPPSIRPSSNGGSFSGGAASGGRPASTTEEDTGTSPDFAGPIILMLLVIAAAIVTLVLSVRFINRRWPKKAPPAQAPPHTPPRTAAPTRVTTSNPGRTRPPGSSPHVFINYRREDTHPYARLINDNFARRWGDESVFMDLTKIWPGVDFTDAIKHAVDVSDVTLVLIGRTWITASDSAGRRRLDEPTDWVASEIASAIAHRRWVVPVLVQAARMPRAEELPPRLTPLANLNAFVLSDDHFSSDLGELMNLIETRVRVQAES